MAIDSPAPAALKSGARDAQADPDAGVAVHWVTRHSLIVFLLLVAVGSLRIAGTYQVFSHTWDEPNHIAVGTEWLVEGTMEFDNSHPPLARVAAALGPYLAGGWRHAVPRPDYKFLHDQPSASGLAILERDGGYDRNLALARLGILPFFWIACLTVYLWTRRYLGEPAATFAVFFFTFLPPILANAGLATTDMALTAFVGASFPMMVLWFERPVPRNSLFLGAIIGLAVLSKFSALPFMTTALVAALAWQGIAVGPGFLAGVRFRNYRTPLAIAVATCCLIVWAGYRFSFGVAFGPGAGLLSRISLPAPEFFSGILNVARHDTRGHPAFLLGQRSDTGWWYFFPVVLAVKTPLPFLAMALTRVVAARKNTGVRMALAFSLGILLFCMTRHLNMGSRHILPVYLGLSVTAGAGAEHLLTRLRASVWAGWTLATLMVWMIATSALSHPDYLPYFNALAGDKPENVLTESDLDWGQDVKRLGTRLKQVGAQAVAFTPDLPVDLQAMGFPATAPAGIKAPAAGWNAVSLAWLKLSRPQGGDPWQERITPQEKVGKGIWLWYFPPNSPLLK